MKTYDFLFAGGGLAGLYLACQIARSPLRSSSMLIVDPDPKERDDRTFSYWSNRPGLFDQAVSLAWDQLAFHAPGFSCTAPLGTYRYQTMRGIDFYCQARRELAACPGVDFQAGRTSRLVDGPDGAILTVNGQEFSGKWAFDSRPKPAGLALDPSRYHYLQLAFRGWEVATCGSKTSQPVFDPQVATLMDFRTAQHGDVRFFYVLPDSTQRALVEYTLFTSRPRPLEAGQAALESYLREAFGLTLAQDCQATPREGGSLPVSDQPFPRQAGRRVLAIGLRGGRLKPTSGYAFTRIQRDSQAILRSLLENGHPFDLPEDPPLFGQMDAIMLEVMARHPGRITDIFTALFSRNPLERVFRFLDEDATLREVLQLIATLPPGLFLKILARRSLAPRAFLQGPISE